MSLSPSSITRTPPPAERSSQRSERAPAGDFAALLELVPTPASGSAGRAADRGESDRGAADFRGDRGDRSAAMSPRSRHARPDGGRPAGSAGQHAPRPDDPAGRADADGEPTADADAAESVPAPGAPAPRIAAAAAEAATSPHHLTAVSAAPSAESPVTVPVVDQPAGVAVVGGPLTPSTAALPAADAEVPSSAVTVPGAFAGAPLVATAPAPDGHTATLASVVVPAAALAEAPVAPASAAVPPATAAPTPTAPVTVPIEAAAVPSDVAGTHAVPATDAAVAVAGAVGSDAEGGTPAGAESVTGELPTGSGAGSSGARDGQPGRGSSPEVAEAPAAGSAPTSAATALPSFGRPDAGAFGPHRSVPLERAPRAVAQLLHVASQQGVSHARIALRPVELGGIEIFLQVSPAGLSAQLVAESPEAARMLTQATEDLRRSLAGQNVELVSLDVSTSAEQQQRDDLASRGSFADERMPGGEPASRGGAADSEPAVPSPDLTTPTVIELPDGLLVDVLA